MNIGDGADMPSLSSYDKGKRSFQGRAYAKDIAAHHEFEDRLWAPAKRAKKKGPRKVAMLGNHDWRIEKALDESPELIGTIGVKDLAYNDNYDEVVPYQGSLPGTIIIEGVTFAHFLTSGIMGRPIGGENPATALLTKQFTSCVVGHSHLQGYALRTTATGQRVQAVVAGCYQDYPAPWCGEQVQRLWWAGVVMLRGVSKGQFDPEFISIGRLKAAYGK